MKSPIKMDDVMIKYTIVFLFHLRHLYYSNTCPKVNIFNNPTF